MKSGIMMPFWKYGEGSDGERFWDVANALLFLDLGGSYGNVFIL